MTTTSYYKKLQFGIWRIFPGFFCQQPKYSSHIMLRTLTTFSMTKYQEMGKIKAEMNSIIATWFIYESQN